MNDILQLHSAISPSTHPPISSPPDLPFDKVQFTLVDCPGHASLIRTIIGGAQIIDVMFLVIDVNKGIQTQTAECLVIGEILTNNMIVVLNKIDLIPEAVRADKIEKVRFASLVFECELSVLLFRTKFSSSSRVHLCARRTLV